MKTPLVPADLFSLVTLGDPVLAPDGRTVYFRRMQPDRATDATLSSLWRIDAAGRSAPFTTGKKDRLPRLAPDGAHLAFVGERDEQPQIYVIPTAGGEPRAVSPPYARISALAWSPDGTRLLYCATSDHDPVGARIFHDVPSGARHIRALPFKSDSDGLLDGIRLHAFVLDVASGACEQVTQGDFDVSAPGWSPDGAHLAFAASIGFPEWSFRSDIHVVEIASRRLRTLTSGDGQYGSPAWSHDGATLAFVGCAHGDDGGGRFNDDLWVIPAAGGAGVSLSAALDRTAGDLIIGDLRSGFGGSPPAWSDDDREIFVQISDSGSCGVHAFARDGGGVRTVAGGDRDIYAFAQRAKTCVIAYSTPLVPCDLALLADGAEYRLTTVNDGWLSEKLVVPAKRFRPLADDATQLDAWILVPPERPLPLPLVLEVHGGPHAAYGHNFFFEFQILAGAGFAVAYGNPRGSQSYGRAYANAITGKWGGIDASDVQRILDGALAEAPIDRARVGIAGGSYGGFMTTWLLGHSDRFAAGVSMRAVNDFVSEVGASDVGWFLERELDAPPNLGDRGRLLFDGSPLRAAPQIDAPLLVEHSERDYRCPIDQGEQLFTLLRRLGKKRVEFVRFTGDGHELSRGGKPRNRILRLRAIAHWFIRHLAPAGIAAVADEAGALFRPLANEPELDALAPTSAAP